MNNKKAKRRRFFPPSVFPDALNVRGEEVWPYARTSAPMESALLWGKELADQNFDQTPPSM